MSKTKYFFYTASLLLLPFLIAGCGVWNDFTTYFNVYYNTTTLFDQVESEIAAQNKELFSTTELVVPAGTQTNITKIIEKTSQILQFHQSSGFVDNALFMLGKSFYYQKNYLKALKKFQELTTSQPQSDLLLETKLWIGKTQMRLRSYTDALTILKEVREEAVKEGETEIVRDSYVEEIVYHLIKENFAQAVTVSEEFAAVTKDKEIKAEIYFEIGELYFKLKDYAKAIEAYNRVFEFSPSYKTEQNTRLQMALAARETGDVEKAYDLLTDMRLRDKYVEVYSRVDLETGVTLNMLGRYQEAIDRLTIADTSYLSDSTSGVAKFRKAQVYEKGLMNYDSAYVYYQKATAVKSYRNITQDAIMRSQVFKKYFYIRSLIDDNTQALRYSLNPDEFIKDSIDFHVRDSIRKAENERLAYERMNEAELDSFRQGLITDTTKTDTTKKGDTTKVVQNDNGKGKTEGGTLFPPNNNPLNTPTGRNTAGNNNFNNPGNYGVVSPRDTVEKPPMRPVLPADTLKANVVKSEYDLANLFFTELDVPDSAYYYYNDIVTKYPNSGYEGRTLYAIASYYLTKNDSVKADSLFNYIYENFRTDKIVNAAAMKLKKPVIDLEYDPAKELYYSAEKDLADKQIDSSLVKFTTIYNEYPTSPLAPKALYASGWILENEKKLYDSAAAVYDTVTTKYPQTQYAAKVRPKIMVYKQERERLRIVREDSIKKEQARLDSLRLTGAEQLDSLRRQGTSSDSAGVFNQIYSNSIDSLKMLDRKKNTAPPKLNPVNSQELDVRTPAPGDTLLQRHYDALDSLRRNDNRGTGIDSTGKNLGNAVDSLNTGRVK